MIQHEFNKKYTPSLWEWHVGFCDSQMHLAALILSLKAGSCLRRMKRSCGSWVWVGKRQRRAGLNASRNTKRDLCILIVCSLRLCRDESKRCDNVFTYQEPTWSSGSWHFGTSSDKRLLLHRDAKQLGVLEKMSSCNTSFGVVLISFTSAIRVWSWNTLGTEWFCTEAAGPSTKWSTFSRHCRTKV